MQEKENEQEQQAGVEGEAGKGAGWASTSSAAGEGAGAVAEGGAGNLSSSRRRRRRRSSFGHWLNYIICGPSLSLANVHCVSLCAGRELCGSKGREGGGRQQGKAVDRGTASDFCLPTIKQGGGGGVGCKLLGHF